MRPVLPEETWKHIDEFFRKTPEAPSKLPFFQKAMQEALAEGERLGEQRGEQRGERIGALHTQQQTLIRLLRRKFSDVPDEVVRHIEAAEDTERLNEWLDGILDADTLADMGLGTDGKSSNPEVNRTPSGNESTQ